MSTQDREYPEGNDRVLSKGPCPKCGSSDNCVTYADGHQTCFTPGCKHWKPPDGREPPGTSHSKATPAAPITGNLLDSKAYPTAFDPLTKRRITADTLKQFGYFSARYDNQPVQAAPFYSMDGDLVLQKLRFPDKDFVVLKAHPRVPALGECMLFGRHVYGDRFDRQVIVTEGELDALSVAQAIGNKTAVVSVNGGAQSAAKCLKANYLWLDRFDDIVLWLDDDEPGRAAMEECAKLFKVGKVRIAKAGSGHKDASDLLQAGLPGDITAAIYKAQAWRPRGIVNAADLAGDIRAPREKLPVFQYPATMPKLQEMTGGMHLGEVTFHVAGTGVGKSTQLREIVYDLATRQGVKVGAMWFEDTRRDCQLLLMSLEANRRLQLDPLPDPDSPSFEQDAAAYDERMLRLHRQVFGSRRFELFDAETAEWTFDAVESYVRYMARALDCLVVVIDPLSYVAALMDSAADERRALDMIAARMAKAAKEMGIVIIISHHLRRTQGIPHEEGAATSLNELRSSGGLANSSSCVIGWERNNQAEGDGWRVTRSRVLKPHRLIGRSGLADTLYYGEDGRLVRSPMEFPPVGKPGGRDNDNEGTRGGGFGPLPRGAPSSEDY